MARIVVIGEAMLELVQMGENWQLGYGGDTLNTAIHLARAGHDVAYFKALSVDPLSAELKAIWAADGIDTSLVLDHHNRSTGLYPISTDAAGERSFAYWRDTSAAREMFNLPGSSGALAKAATVDLLAFSLISLAILPDDGSKRLLDLASQVWAKGGKVAFDGNYRRRLWTDLDEATQWRDRAIRVADFGLPTLEDETALTGPNDVASVAAYWQGLGCGETVVNSAQAGAVCPMAPWLRPKPCWTPSTPAARAMPSMRATSVPG